MANVQQVLQIKYGETNVLSNSIFLLSLEDSKLQSATAKQKHDRKIKFDRG